jgi:hypothetical protein
MFTRLQAEQVKPHVVVLNPDDKTSALMVEEVVYYEKFGWTEQLERVPGSCQVTGLCVKMPKPNRDKKEKCPKVSAGPPLYEFKEGNFLLVVKDFNNNKWAFYPTMKSNPKVLP